MKFQIDDIVHYADMDLNGRVFQVSKNMAGNIEYHCTILNHEGEPHGGSFSAIEENLTATEIQGGAQA